MAKGNKGKNKGPSHTKKRSDKGNGKGWPGPNNQCNKIFDSRAKRRRPLPHFMRKGR